MISFQDSRESEENVQDEITETKNIVTGTMLVDIEVHHAF